MSMSFVSFVLLMLSQLTAEPATRVVEVANVPALMDFACSVLEYDCAALEPPQVILAPLYEQGILGAFDPASPNAIYIDTQIMPYFDAEYIRSIVVHELTHYIDWHLKGPESMMDICAVENRGWRIGNAWLVSNGRPELADFTWNIRYGCYR